MRKLIYIPVVHTEVDMGSMNKEIKMQYINKFGQDKWDQHVRVVSELWEGLKKRILALKLNYKKVRIYQDGLPLCGKEEKIVKDLVAKGSVNHMILFDLMHKGAKIEGTEDPNILLEEYKMMQNVQAGKSKIKKIRAIQDYERKGAELLKKRDRFIANRIDETLKDGETGLLFIGMVHRVDEVLPSDISVSYLIHRLPFKRNFEIKKIYG